MTWCFFLPFSVASGTASATSLAYIQIFDSHTYKKKTLEPFIKTDIQTQSKATKNIFNYFYKEGIII